uniref:Uncharacterized protein n=1 Tax=Arundo donax TaxID=35708 RepID=A0A0A9ALT2_ARUDO
MDSNMSFIQLPMNQSSFTP